DRSRGRGRRQIIGARTFSRTKERAAMRTGEPRHRHHRRPRHRQDDLAAIADVGLKPTLAAPTGRAARRLQEASGRDAKTIHRLLEYAPESGGFLRNKNFPLRTNYLIIDEASMMDIELASSLLSALMPNCSLLLVGDRDQLPSVGPGSVLKDVIASDFVPVVQLQEVYRQARRSLIVANAHRLNRGEFPQISNDAEGDFFFFERNAAEDVLATIKQLVQ